MKQSKLAWNFILFHFRESFWHHSLESSNLSTDDAPMEYVGMWCSTFNYWNGSSGYATPKHWDLCDFLEFDWRTWPLEWSWCETKCLSENILTIWKANYRHVMIWRFLVPPKHIDEWLKYLEAMAPLNIKPYGYLFLVPSRWLARQCPKRQRSRWQKHDAVAWRRVVYKNSTIWVSFRCNIETLQGWINDDYDAVTIAGMS